VSEPTPAVIEPDTNTMPPVKVHCEGYTVLSGQTWDELIDQVRKVCQAGALPVGGPSCIFIPGFREYVQAVVYPVE